jgi:hypothetical protein
MAPQFSLITLEACWQREATMFAGHPGLAKPSHTLSPGGLTGKRLHSIPRRALPWGAAHSGPHKQLCSLCHPVTCGPSAVGVRSLSSVGSE